MPASESTRPLPNLLTLFTRTTMRGPSQPARDLSVLGERPPRFCSCFVRVNSRTHMYLHMALHDASHRSTFLRTHIRMNLGWLKYGTKAVGLINSYSGEQSTASRSTGRGIPHGRFLGNASRPTSSSATAKKSRDVLPSPSNAEQAETRPEAGPFSTTLMLLHRPNRV
jgi:hypothetical protein